VFFFDKINQEVGNGQCRASHGCSQILGVSIPARLATFATGASLDLGFELRAAVSAG
jgi:hypothetical protein